MKLVLVRECRAQMSEENKFMGWTDSPLSILGQKTAHAIGKKLGKLNIEFFYSSPFLFLNCITIGVPSSSKLLRKVFSKYL